MTSLEAMNSTISNLHNTLSEENDDIIIYNDCQNEIKDILIVMANILNGLVANIEAIKNSKGNDKKKLNIKKFVKILDLTKDQDIQQYFYSMEIYGYYEIDIEVKKDWLGIFFTIFIGSLEIVGGCLLLWATAGQIGSEFIEEGYDDIKYGIECLIGTKEFSWSDYKKKKISFLINTAISITIKLLIAGISGF